MKPNILRIPCFLITMLLVCLYLKPTMAQDDLVVDTVKIADIYKRKCAGCHGMEGDGEGPGANIVNPKPRNFMTWMFKLKSTPVDYAPLDEDIERIINDGMPGTSMPGFKDILTEQEVKGLAKYLARFSFFDIEPVPDSVVVNIIQPTQDPDIELGKEIYKKFDCKKCHGEQGRGNGTSFAKQFDDWENQTLPRNFSKPWIYRRGSTAQDIYTILKLGVPGTPMPSFVETLEQEGGDEDMDVEHSLWSLAHYVQSMQDEANFETTVKVKFSETLPDDPLDAIWNDIPAARFNLIGQVVYQPRHFTPSVEDIVIKAIHNGSEIVLLSIWDDRTETSDTLPDKMAIQFPVKNLGRKKPFFFLGDGDNAVNLWVFDNGEIYEAKGEGPGKFERQENNDLTGTWKYDNGRYYVLFKRPMNTGDENDAVLMPESFTSMALLAWDGFFQETGNKCSVSTWYYLVPESAPDLLIYLWVLLAMVITVGVEMLIVHRARKNNQLAVAGDSASQTEDYQ